MVNYIAVEASFYNIVVIMSKSSVYHVQNRCGNSWVRSTSGKGKVWLKYPPCDDFLAGADMASTIGTTYNCVLIKIDGLIKIYERYSDILPDIVFLGFKPKHYFFLLPIPCMFCKACVFIDKYNCYLTSACLM